MLLNTTGLNLKLLSSHQKNQLRFTFSDCTTSEMIYRKKVILPQRIITTHDKYLCTLNIEWFRVSWFVFKRRKMFWVRLESVFLRENRAWNNIEFTMRTSRSHFGIPVLTFALLCFSVSHNYSEELWFRNNSCIHNRNSRTADTFALLTISLMTHSHAETESMPSGE